jgi:predicted enzyme related to lactoylglutathione lyase
MATKKKTRKPVAQKAKKVAAPKPKKVAASRKAVAKDRRNKSKAETLRLRSAAPGFTVNDIDKSYAFYTDVLGFTPKERWERDGKLAGIELLAGNVTFYLGQDDWKKGRDRIKGQGFRIYCSTVQNIDALAAKVKAAGGTVTEEPTDRPWGSRDFGLVDPDGYSITISKDLKKK